MLSLKQLNDVCLANTTSSDRCRFLHQDPSEPDKFFCLKLTGKGAKIDQEANNYIVEMRRKGRDPGEDGMPLGDNCPGYPLMRNIVQGYDQD